MAPDPETFHPGQMVTVFRSRLTDAAGSAYDDTADEMLRTARQAPGFVDFKTFVADDGERVSLVTFEDSGSHDAWRRDPDHRAAQVLGRERFYAWFRIQVCRCEKVTELDT
jgi:heme-degrading monooxygenase HmoA